MDQDFKNYIAITNRKILDLPDDVNYGKLFHITSTKNVKKILQTGFNSGTYFAKSESDLLPYKRQVVKPHVMVCLVQLDGVVWNGYYFVSQKKLIQSKNSIWMPVD